MKNFLIKSIKNKYLVVSLVFVIWVGFIDDRYNLMRQIRMSSTIKANEKESKQLLKEIDQKKVFIENLKSDINFVEKYGRENNYIKKEGEVIYQIVSSN